jgi:hypothetical protein
VEVEDAIRMLFFNTMGVEDSNQSNCNRAISYYYATLCDATTVRERGPAARLWLEIEVQKGIVLEGQNPER